MSVLRWAPVAVFAALAGLFASQLLAPEASCARPNTDVDRAPPSFDVARLAPETGRFTAEDLKGDGPTVVNIWASWCAPCRVEHPQLMALAESGKARIVGIDYKDQPEKARAFLAELGDPFDTVLYDPDGEAATAFGITGVPETFVVDAEGRITYRHVGQITASEVGDCLAPAIERAR
ncbi:MAG: DsbE family thiol:disulfide interchange protein [Pseudomonadota bacterium]